MFKIVNLDNHGQNCHSGQSWSKLSLWRIMVKIVNLDKSGQIVNLDKSGQNCQSGQI